jgi:hypothetical protein
MSDPRNAVAYAGVLTARITLKHDNSIVYDPTKAGGSAQAGRAVALTITDDTVGLADDGVVIYGKLISVESGGMCAVQIRGFCTLPGGNGATLTVGAKIVGALNATSDKGFVKALAETVTTPTAAEVTNAFKAAKTRGVIHNNDVTTAVVVDLG